MSTARELGLRLVPYFPQALYKKDEPLIYSVDGFPAAHFVLIGSEGVGLTGIRSWYVHWYQDTVMIPALTRLYDSPEEAMEAAAEFWTAQAERDPDWR
jgi:hypothetical protein